MTVLRRVPTRARMPWYGHDSRQRISAVAALSDSALGAKISSTHIYC